VHDDRLVCQSRPAIPLPVGGIRLKSELISQARREFSIERKQLRVVVFDRNILGNEVLSSYHGAACGALCIHKATDSFGTCMLMLIRMGDVALLKYEVEVLPYTWNATLSLLLPPFQLTDPFALLRRLLRNHPNLPSDQLVQSVFFPLQKKNRRQKSTFH